MSHLVESGESGVWATTVSFFSLVMLAATQDIAVDGWAITILAKENISYASTCQVRKPLMYMCTCVLASLSHV